MSDEGPIYRHIEFCRNAGALWEKLKSGHWDWLGVHPDGKFVLGSPPTSRMVATVARKVIKPNVPEGLHGIRVYMWNNPKQPSEEEWFHEEAQAKDKYNDRVSLYSDDKQGPGLVKVQRIEQREIVEEEFIVRRGPTYR